MNLKDPRKKKYTKAQLRSPFPITIGKKHEWIVFTAHLSVAGVCIVDPEEMTAVYSMGYFGKGSLSRGAPIFGKRRFGAPPLVRDRQWKRRQQWLEEVNKLHSEAFPIVSNDHNSHSPSDKKPEASSDIPSSDKDPQESLQVDEPMEICIPEENGKDNVAKDDGATAGPSKTPDKLIEVDEVVLDSTEDEEVCEILDTNTRQRNDSQSSEIFVINDDNVNQPLEPDDYFDKSYSPEEEIEEINPHEVVVLPDSDSDTENYLKTVKPRIETEGFPVTETLQLTFEETFFLMYGLGCLQLINYDGKLLSIVETWNRFNEQDQYFLPRYIVYHYFRSKGWVVKPGMKFGGDLLLYKQGPPFYHASYIVVVETVDPHTLLRDESKSTRRMTWNGLMQSNRLAETAAKEFMIAQVLWPLTISPQSNSVPLEALSEFTVRELLWRRWRPRRTDAFDPLEDEISEDDDSS